MATASNFFPSVHLHSHCSSCGHTRPQIAGSRLSADNVLNADSNSPAATCVMNVGMSIPTGHPAMHGSFLHSMQRLASAMAISMV